MKHPVDLSGYHDALSYSFLSLSSFLPLHTPLNRVAGDISEMISSYLSDAGVFRAGGDTVNEFASLAYLHGWLDAGLFLGFFSGTSPDIVLPESSVFSSELHPRLEEKTQRYEQMLNSAFQSVEIAPESGSPLYEAAAEILQRVEKVCTMWRSTPPSVGSYARALGQFSYEYGWLDAGLRAGLFRILANPELFTTETSRRF